MQCNQRIVLQGCACGFLLGCNPKSCSWSTTSETQGGKSPLLQKDRFATLFRLSGCPKELIICSQSASYMCLICTLSYPATGLAWRGGEHGGVFLLVFGYSTLLTPSRDLSVGTPQTLHQRRWQCPPTLTFSSFCLTSSSDNFCYSTAICLKKPLQH